MVTLLLSLVGCGTSPEAIPEPEVVLPEPALRRLTVRQYGNTLQDLYGVELVLPASLEPDTTLEGLASLGSGISSVSPLGVERYESGARLVAEQLFGEGAPLACTPTGPSDQACATTLLRAEGERLFRRPLTDEELGTYVDLHLAVAAEAGDFRTGGKVALATMLQSPNFLYRTEHTTGALNPHELAVRMAYFLWNGPPDDALLLAVESGALDSAEGRAEQVDRMIADARYRRGVRDFFTELFELNELSHLRKDPNVFAYSSPELWASAREETLSVLERNIVDDEGDYRSLFTSYDTYIDRRLAALYDVPAPDPAGFAWTELPSTQGRRGLLGHASMLALYAHPTSSSATRRGHFVRSKLLCHFIAPPPADVDTSIPEASNAPTLRDRLQVHQEDPTCSGCHIPLDSAGLGLENFDGVGRWRTHENQALIDPSGTLDGADYSDAAGLGEVIANHRDLPHCLAERLYDYAVGHPTTRGEEDVVDWARDRFVQDGHSVKALMRTIALSDAFAKGGF